jgi:Protein of unknown function (DUF1566)
MFSTDVATKKNLQTMSTNSAVYRTDQIRCYDGRGQEIDCAGTGQDGDISAGHPWPKPRFEEKNAVVKDILSGLMWTKNATPAEFPQTWGETFEYVNRMNALCSHGYDDWRLPDRRELFSLISHSRFSPVLPAAHPFTNFFAGYYWTSIPCAQWPKQAWYIHLGGGRMFKGMKQCSYLLWPVRRMKSVNTVAPSRLKTGERFETLDHVATDRSTGFMWLRSAMGPKGIVDWPTALSAIHLMNVKSAYGYDDWRLPNIRGLESLVALDLHSPALPESQPFQNVGQGYWSSTTSVYDTSYAWVLYSDDGNVAWGSRKKQILVSGRSAAKHLSDIHTRIFHEILFPNTETEISVRCWRAIFSHPHHNTSLNCFFFTHPVCPSTAAASCLQDFQTFIIFLDCVGFSFMRGCFLPLLWISSACVQAVFASPLSPSVQ